MRHFRNVIRIVGGKEKRLAERIAAAKAHVKEAELNRTSTSTQHTAAACRHHRDNSASILDEQRLRIEVNAKNASFYRKNLERAEDLRLLRIEPGSGTDAVCCSLEYGSMEDDQLEQYDALSYCWGSQRRFESIKVDGQDDFRVSEHLYAALTRLRRQDRPRVMWVDVICVNQDNIPERNRSVSLIWKIYTKARRVIVWIGETDPDVPNCPRRWPNVQDGDKRLALCAKPGLAAFEHGNVKVKLSELLREMEFNSATKGAGEVWWKRLWVVQEFACAKAPPTVYIGPHAISWEFFSMLMHTDTHNRLMLFESLRSQEDQSLMRLILSARSFQCSDPRDRIYALLGLSKDMSMPSPIVPDYTKSIKQVYEEATLHLIREEGNMDVLLDDRADRADAQFPTWVPDFSVLRELELSRTVDRFAAGHAEECIRPDADFVERQTGANGRKCRMLRIKALYFDEITAKTTEDSIPAPDYNHRGIITKHYHQPAMSEPLQLFQSILAQLNVNYSTEPLHGLDRAPSIGYLILQYLSGGTRSVVADLEQAARHIPTQNMLRARKVSVDKIAEKFGIALTNDVRDDILVAAACESAFLWTRHTRSWTPDDAWHRIWFAKNSNTSESPYAVALANHQCDFFATSHGFIGLGPARLEVGDKVVVPFGASRPFVVRKSKNGEHYQLVGDAVVPGIMSGQLIHLHQEGVLKAVDYHLM